MWILRHLNCKTRSVSTLSCRNRAKARCCLFFMSLPGLPLVNTLAYSTNFSGKLYESTNSFFNLLSCLGDRCSYHSHFPTITCWIFRGISWVFIELFPEFSAREQRCIPWELSICYASRFAGSPIASGGGANLLRSKQGRRAAGAAKKSCVCSTSIRVLQKGPKAQELKWWIGT